MEFLEARTLAAREKARYQRLEEMFALAEGLEARVKERQKQDESLAQKIDAQNQRFNEKQVEQQEMIDSMTQGAEEKAAKARSMLEKITNHCNEQAILIRDKFVKDKKKMEGEIGDMSAKKEQLAKAVRKLQTQEQELMGLVDAQKKQLESRPTALGIVTEAGLLQQQRELEKVKEQVAKARSDFAQERSKLEAELGNLRSQRSQLGKEIDLMKGQQAGLNG
jgi:chromosome segregation ATPase